MFGKIRYLMLALISAALPSRAAALPDIYLAENFSTAPENRGWQTHGSASLFAWNATNHNLEVTWDSAQPTSYFHLPLGATITSTNDFMFGFDLRLRDVAVGTTPGNPWSFQLAASLLNFTNATNPAFSRAAGYFPNVVEFNFFPYAGGIYGPGIYATAISSAGDFSGGGFTEWIDLDTNALYHVELRFFAANRRLVTRLTRDGQPAWPLNEAWLPENFGDFQVDTLAVSSYNDAVPWEGGSVLAHGTVDNLFFISPPPVATQAGRVSGGGWETVVASRLDWNYQLQRSTDFKAWGNVGAAVPGTGIGLSLKDLAPPAGGGFYRVQALRP